MIFCGALSRGSTDSKSLMVARQDSKGLDDDRPGERALPANRCLIGMGDYFLLIAQSQQGGRALAIRSQYKQVVELCFRNFYLHRMTQGLEQNRNGIRMTDKQHNILTAKDPDSLARALAFVRLGSRRILKSPHFFARNAFASANSGLPASA